MPDLFNQSKEMQMYYDALPENIQRMIIDYGTKINCLDDLKTVSRNLTNRFGTNLYNPTVSSTEKTEMQVPIISTENVEYSKEYQEENEL